MISFSVNNLGQFWPSLFQVLSGSAKAKLWQEQEKDWDSGVAGQPVSFTLNCLFCPLLSKLD